MLIMGHVHLLSIHLYIHLHYCRDTSAGIVRVAERESSWINAGSPLDPWRSGGVTVWENAMKTPKPELRAFRVVKRRGGKDLWQPIGSAFADKDGKGYTVILQEQPYPDGDGQYRIMLRSGRP